MAFGGGKYLRFFIWVAKKKTQVFIRAYLSHVLALTLAVMVTVREWGEFSKISLSIHQPNISGFDLFVFAITAATFGAAIWEFFGNKLTTSPQESRFLKGIRAQLFELEKFAYGNDRTVDPTDRLAEFVEGFLDVASNTLCAHRHVDGGLMVESPEKDCVMLVSSSKAARYPKTLSIPIPSNETTSTGPAGWSFQRTQIVYMPSKEKKESWPFDLLAENGSERYEPSEPLKGWIAASEPNLENFRSVLCVPVAIYQEKRQKRKFGVLNFSTSARDPFVDRDFMMAECFGSILAHAFAISQKEKGR
jgi:hypothetical protein